MSGKNILPPNSMTPDDFVANWNYPQGAFVRGKPAGAHLDVSRPLPKLTNYRTSMKNLYLGGAYMHPSAIISGVPGQIAAKVMVSDLGVSIPASV